jgi:hypothetical protein
MELKKIVDVIHDEDRLACLHLNRAGVAANPMATKTKPKAPSAVTCATSGQESDPLSKEDIKAIIAGGQEKELHGQILCQDCYAEGPFGEDALFYREPTH